MNVEDWMLFFALQHLEALWSFPSIFRATKNAIICCHSSFFTNQVFLGWGVLLMILFALEGQHFSWRLFLRVVSSQIWLFLAGGIKIDGLCQGFINECIYRNCDPPPLGMVFVALTWKSVIFIISSHLYHLQVESSPDQEFRWQPPQLPNEPASLKEGQAAIP